MSRHFMKRVDFSVRLNTLGLHTYSTHKYTEIHTLIVDVALLEREFEGCDFSSQSNEDRYQR